MNATPQSCNADGSWPSRIAPRPTEAIGWIVRIIDVSAAGSRGSENVISSQPTTCEVSASVTSQPALGQVGARSSTPIARPNASEMTAATNDISKSAPAGRRRSIDPWRCTSRYAA
jgi:hypothetical protein